MILSLRILDMSVKTTVLEEGARGPVAGDYGSGRTEERYLRVYSPRTSEATAAPTAPQAASTSLPTLVSAPAALAVAAGRGGARPVTACVAPLTPR